MGAWIEIGSTWEGISTSIVAPFMGAWIEIIFICMINLRQIGRTLYGCVD